MNTLTEDHIRKIISGYGNDPQQLIAVLLDIQNASGINCVERKWAELVSQVLDVPLSKIYDVLTFYAMFSVEPQGRFVIEICRSTPCHYSGGAELVGLFEKAAGLKMGETSADGKITLQYTSCIGACDTGPAVKIGDDVFGSLTEEKINSLVKICREGSVEGLRSLCN